MTNNEVANLALSHIGLTTKINDIDSEKTMEAKQCRLFYDVALKESLEECRYGASTIFEPLSLVEKNPTSEWEYSYRYPSDCMFLSRIMRENAEASPAYRSYPYINGETDIEYRIVFDRTNGKLVYTNKEKAKAEYIVLNENVKMSLKFWLGLSYRLAAYIAPSLAKNSSANVVDRMLTMSRMKIQQAQAKNWNEQKYDEEDDRSSLELARRGY